jgi:hypothetical protein
MNAGIRAGSVASGHFDGVFKETPQMLARRFTIVCLLMSLFGMFFAILVAEAGRPARSWDAASSSSCQFDCMNHFRP